MTEARVLRSKKLRAALFIAAGGRCRMCARELGQGWHADHVVPWVTTKTTNVHDMQALCADCNLRKGAKTMGEHAKRMAPIEQMVMRPHQKEALEIANKIVAGQWSKKSVIADVTPGGGKTPMSLVFASALLRAGVIDQVFHFVPRATLRSQVEEAWTKRTSFNPGGFQIIESDNSAPLYRSPLAGVVASYDQLARNPDLYIEAARRKPTLAVFDELQFLGDEQNAVWARASFALSEFSDRVLGMTGTLWRHDGQRIPFIEYDEPNDRGERLPLADIRYSLARAIADRAVKPAEFAMLDGDVRFHFNGEEIESTLSRAEGDDERRALRTFLLKETTWKPLVDKAVEHWRGWRREVYPSRIIAVAFDQEHAKKVRLYIEQHHNLRTALAISEEGDDARRNAIAFRKSGKPDVLVTVAMASVGFDAPDCTHMAYLTNIRSVPYALQAFARVTRIDYNSSVAPEYQNAFIFVPDDRRMRAIVQWMREETARGLKERKIREPGPDGPEPPRPPSSFVPIASSPGHVSFDGMRGPIADEDSALVRQAIEQCPEAVGIPPSKLATIIRFARGIEPNEQSDSPPPTLEQLKTPSQRRKEKRQISNALAAKIDTRLGVEIGTTNRELFRLWARPVSDLSEPELDQRIAWLTGKLESLDV